MSFTPILLWMGTIFEVAVSFGQIGHEQMLDQRFGISATLIHKSRENNLTLQDVPVNTHRIIITEGIDPDM